MRGLCNFFGVDVGHDAHLSAGGKSAWNFILPRPTACYLDCSFSDDNPQSFDETTTAFVCGLT
jgi:hypothetical protein